MSMLPLVSVLTPTFNRAAFLPETIASVLGQDYPAFELLVLDDGSTDETPALLANLADARLRVLRHDNMGQARTLNRGFELARGELLMVVNSDDPLLPGALERLVARLGCSPDAVLAYGDYELVDDRGALLGPGPSFDGSFADMVRLHACVSGPAAMFRRTAQQRAGGWDPSYRFVPDLEFLFRLGLLGSFRRVPEVLARYRSHPGALTAERGSAMAREHVRAVESLFARADLPPAVTAVQSEALRTAYIAAGLTIDEFPNFPGERFAVADRMAVAPSAAAPPVAPPSSRTAPAVIEWLHREVAYRDADIERLHAAVAVRDAEIRRLHAAAAELAADVAALRSGPPARGRR